jgi:predicted esterase
MTTVDRQRAGGAGRGRLTFRPPSGIVATSGQTGAFRLTGLAGAEPAAVYVPPVAEGESLRLVVMLHGAGGVPESALNVLREEADRGGLVLLAPKSRAATWDVIAGGYGPDVRQLDRLLVDVAAAYPIRAYTVGGFSDGASYALSLGRANGDVFDSVIAFSPGFDAAEVQVGRPRVFISHGTEDRVLPIDRCSRQIVQTLEASGYEVSYHEFEGGHVVPAALRREAVAWLEQDASS